MRHELLDTRAYRTSSLSATGAACLVLAACAAGEAITPLDPPPATVAGDTLVLSPVSARLHPGDTVRFTAPDRTAIGSAATGRVQWTATGGEIDSAGLFRATTTGDFEVRALRGGKSGRSRVKVDPAVAVALVVSPDTAALVPGGVQQFAAEARDARGLRVPVPLRWAATGGTIDGTGRYVAGSTAGSYLVVVRDSAGTLADTARVRVAASAPVLTACVVSPATATVAAGGTQQFAATGRRSDGSTTAVTVSWSATGGTIGGNGLFTAGTMAGNYRVLAAVAATTISCGADVAVTPPPAPTLVAVELAPASASLTAGAAQQFGATGRYSDGSSSAVNVSWTATGGTVTGGGLYTAGSTAGTWRVVALHSASGLADTAVVTIAAPPPPSGGTLANECASPQPGWIWCDDFEQDRLARYFEYDNAGGLFARAGGVGTEGSSGMRARFNTGTVGAGSLKLALGRTPSTYFRPVDPGTANYRELWWRFYLRLQPGWTGGGAEKLTRMTVLASSNWAQAMIAHGWSGGPSEEYLVLDPARGTDAQGNLVTTQYNDFANLTWLGAVQGAARVYASASAGQWRCIELHVRLNDAGQANGVFESWVDGQLDARKTGLNWVGSYAAYGLNAVFLENFWNDGSPVAQERYFDNLVVSTQPIGCGR